MKEIEKIALSKIKGIGPKTSKILLSHFGSVSAIFESSKKQLLQLPGINSSIADYINSKTYIKEAEEELLFIQQHKIEMLWIEDDKYPQRLKNCDDSPILLYYKGTEVLNSQRVISIVGSRKATAYGIKICEDFIRDLQELDVQIVSGLAYGIDIHAHRNAIKNAIPTIAVLGHGLDTIYPSTHRETAAKMISHGGLLTEFPSKTPPDKKHFPMRNRIIAGLSDVTIVIEAAEKGGALITAEIANSYNRDVCAFPGAINQKYSAGCNYLIKTNRAHLIRNVDDLCYLMNWERTTSNKTPKQLSLNIEVLTEEEHKLYQFLEEKNQALVDEITTNFNWPQSKLAIILLEMELKGLIQSLPGKVYKIA